MRDLRCQIPRLSKLRAVKGGGGQCKTFKKSIFLFIYFDGYIFQEYPLKVWYRNSENCRRYSIFRKTTECPNGETLKLCVLLETVFFHLVGKLSQKVLIGSNCRQMAKHLSNERLSLYVEYLFF